MKPGRRWLLLTTLLLTACGSAQGQDEVEPRTAPRAESPQLRATRVEVATIRPTRAGLTLRLPGEVDGSRDASLAAALGGFVERVSAQVGQRVSEGDVLVRVDTALLGAHVSQARAEVSHATLERERAERLEGSIPAAQLDAARAREVGARAALRTAQVTASRGTIRAPFDGVIAAVDIEEGEVAVPGAPLVRLVALDPVHVSLAVPDRDVVALEAGTPVEVRTAALGDVFQGRILRIAPAADVMTRAFEVVVAVDNPASRLLPGMIANVEVQSRVEADRIVIPQYVLVTRLADNGVFVVEGGVARYRPLALGAVIRDQVVVESGLSAGDVVAVTGHRELVDGDPVLVAREGVCCTDGRIQFGAGE